MKLPGKDDPHGNIEGSLARQRVLDILYENKVSIIHQEDGIVVLERDDIILAQDLPPLITGEMVRYLARQFEIDITDFYFKPISGLH